MSDAELEELLYAASDLDTNMLKAESDLDILEDEEQGHIFQNESDKEMDTIIANDMHIWTT